MKTALIGYTGFVGSNILEQKKFDNTYNSENIEEIKGKEYDLIVCAGVKAVKRRANQNPEADLEGIENLINNLKYVSTKKLVLISTVDVYKDPNNVDEDFNLIIENDLHPYGKNRLYLENFIKNNFDNYNIIRLPGLFGNNLKKNVIFDLINNNQTQNIIPNSKFQYYYLGNIWKDIDYIINNNYKEVNLVTEPIETQEIINKFFIDSKVGKNIEKPTIYNVKTKFCKTGYFYSKEEVLNSLEKYINKNKKI